jgi:hypothetical protein
MPGLSLVEDYVAAADAATSIPALNRLTTDAVHALGFDFFGIVHHVTFGPPAAGYVALHCYPEEWVASLRDQGRPPDPVLRAAERVAAGFRWDRMDSIIALTPRERRFMEAAARHGVGGGFTVPNHVPGEVPGSSSFGLRLGRELPERNLPAAQALGNFAFEAARRLIRRRAALDRPGRPLRATARLPAARRPGQERRSHRPAARTPAADGQRAYRGGQAPLRGRHAHAIAGARATARRDLFRGRARSPVITGWAPGAATTHGAARRSWNGAQVRLPAPPERLVCTQAVAGAPRTSLSAGPAAAFERRE